MSRNTRAALALATFLGAVTLVLSACDRAPTAPMIKGPHASQDSVGDTTACKGSGWILVNGFIYCDGDGR